MPDGHARRLREERLEHAVVVLVAGVGQQLAEVEGTGGRSRALRSRVGPTTRGRGGNDQRPGEAPKYQTAEIEPLMIWSRPYCGPTVVPMPKPDDEAVVVSLVLSTTDLKLLLL